MTGTLYIVATPIGNLEDITLRALRLLREVDLIVCEDTRHTRKLLTHFDIQKPLMSCYEQNEQRRLPELIGRLGQGENVALVTDAGTPTISDPGFRLVRKAREEGLTVIPIPGPSAAIAALSASGLPTDRFLFVGFLPVKPGKRRQLLSGLAEERGTLIFYVSPYKLERILQEMLEVFGQRHLTLAREITKAHETFWQGDFSAALNYLKAHPPKGEVTLLVGGA